MLFSLGLGAVSTGLAQVAPPAMGAGAEVIRFSRDWPAQAVPFYAITVRSDGSGFLTTQRDAAEGLASGPAAEAPGGTGPAAAGQDGVGAAGDKDPSGPLQISEATRAKLFAVRPALAGGKGCETGNKHVAQTGAKTLQLRGDGRELQCSFNRSDDKRVEEAVALFGAIEATMEEGPRLRHLRRYDRLGLDAELGTFLGLVKDGRAIEVQNVAGVLRTLAGDGELMERVRNRAADLLAMAQAGK